jgi:pimeloyl-ACP methyl ester carboxylesterase
MSPDVFISYASEDRNAVKSLVDALEAADVSVWWDREIGAGRAFDREIEEALDSARCVVVVWTQAAVASDWVRAEAHEGLRRDTLVPVLLEDVRPPLAFRQMQAIDVRDSPDRLVTSIRELLSKDDTDANATARIRYCKASDGVQIAYAVQGRGRALVRCLGWQTNSHTDVTGQSLVSAELAKHFSLLTYDGRGAGLSERGTFDWTLEQRLDDMTSVINHADFEQPMALCGISEGCRTAVAYAHLHPERVSHLVLHGPAFPTPNPDPKVLERLQWFIDFIRMHWGTRGAMARRMLCTVWAAGVTDEEQEAFMRQQRESMDREAAADYVETLLRQNNDPDESHRHWEMARTVKVPTLIVHSVRDPLVPFEIGKLLAKEMPNAELVPLTLPQHGLGLSEQLDRIIVEETRRFILG